MTSVHKNLKSGDFCAIGYEKYRLLCTTYLLNNYDRTETLF